MDAYRNMFPASFSQIATKEPRRVTHQRQFPLMYLWPAIFTMMIFMTAPCAAGVGDVVCPAGCSCSTVEGFVNSHEVKCSYRGLSDIPAMVNLSTLHTLDLSTNKLSILKNASFSNFSRLSTLILSHNKVEVIEINAFAELQMMRDIDLSYNNLQAFGPKIFSSNPVLDKVNMRGNNLVYLSSDLPILISNSISSLYLSSCSLTKIYPVTFSRVPNLYDLDLSSNKLQTISLHTLEKFPDLRILDLNNNPWRCNCDIVEVMQWAESRREQAPAHKPINCLEGQQYRTLWTMAGGNRSCSESKTTELPGAVGDDGAAVCPSGCDCSPKDGYVNSHEVKCSYLGLSHIPAMVHLWKLHTLDLSTNEIKILRNASFSSLSRLLKLILSNNEVEVIEINAFAGLGMLMEIDLSYNNLEVFKPEIFSSNPVLENVSLRGNSIEVLSSSSPILISDSVSSLDLSSSSVTTIHPISFSRLPKLYFLDLSSNLLQTISVSTFQKLPDLTILKLNNNPWTCNCDFLEVMQWLTAGRQHLSAHRPVKCVEGQQYRILWTMTEGNRSCNESTTTETVVARNREFTTDMAVGLPTVSEGILLPLKASPETTSQRDIENKVKNDGDVVAAPESVFTTDMAVDFPIMSVGIAATLKTSPGTTLQRVIENAVTSEAKLRPAPESETRGCASLLSWNVNSLMVFLILPITLGVAVFVSLIAVNYTKKRCKVHRTQHDNQGTENHVTALPSDVPLLRTQLTTELMTSQAGYENRNSDGYRGAEYHVYEQID